MTGESHRYRPFRDISDNAAEEDRRRLIEQNIIHEFDEATATSNLLGCYGAIQRRRYSSLLDLIVGQRVLDGGCGLGLLSKICLDAGYRVVSIDVDERSIQLAQRLYSIHCRRASVYRTTLQDGAIDTALLFDVIEHLDLAPLAVELTRLGTRRLIVYDSNTSNPLLRWYRRRRNHVEHAEYAPTDIVAGFLAAGFRLTEQRYLDTLALPISGGLQYPPLPVLSHFPDVVLAVDRLVTGALRLMRLDRWLTFRYLLVFDR
jgi:SAM-dependent methyltransferase